MTHSGSGHPPHQVDSKEVDRAVDRAADSKEEETTPLARVEADQWLPQLCMDLS